MSALEIKENKSKEEYKRIIELFEVISEYEKELKRETKALKRVQKTKYVKRSASKQNYSQLGLLLFRWQRPFLL